MSVERHTLEAEVSHCALICDGSVATICGTPLYASLFPITQMRYQSFRPRATGRMEFSVRLVLNSNSVYYKSRVSFFHNANAYWQTLLSALDGKAAEGAASILLRISSRSRVSESFAPVAT